MARLLYLDTEQGRFVSGINSSAVVSLDNVFYGDNVDYEIYFVRSSSTGNTIYEPVDNSTLSIKVAIAPQPPSSVVYVLQDTWTNLPSTVTGSINRTITGASSTNEQQKLTFSSEAFDGTFSLSIPSRTVSFTSVTAGIFTTSGNHGLALYEPFVVTGFTTPSNFTNGQTLYVSQNIASNQLYANVAPTGSAITSYSAASAGSAYTLTASTTAIPARADASVVQSALESVASVGSGNVSVSGVIGREYRMSYQNSKTQTQLALATITGSISGLYGKAATLNFNTVPLQEAISGSASIDAAIEIQQTDGSVIETLVQTSVTIRKDIIDTDAAGSVNVAIPSGFRLLSANGSVWNISADNEGMIQSVYGGAGITSGPSGLAVRSQDGTSYTLAIDNDGILFTTPL